MLITSALENEVSLLLSHPTFTLPVFIQLQLSHLLHSSEKWREIISEYFSCIPCYVVDAMFIYDQIYAVVASINYCNHLNIFLHLVPSSGT